MNQLKKIVKLVANNINSKKEKKEVKIECKKIGKVDCEKFVTKRI
jgi:hypothetical protein